VVESARPAFAVRVDKQVLAEDLGHAGEAAQAALTPAIRELEERDALPGSLRPCEDDAGDGTRLGGCGKLYIPAPDGRWGAVL
jgi:hypothetical protein